MTRIDIQGPRNLTQDGPVVLGNAFQRFPSQVQSIELGIVPFQSGDDPDGLRIVVEPAIRLHRIGQGVFTCVPERCVAQIVRQGHGFRKLTVQAKRAGDGPRDLRDLDRMRKTRPKIVALVLHEDLCLVLQPPEGAGVNDPVAVALKTRPEGALLLRKEPPPAFTGVRCKWRKHVLPVLVRLVPRPYIQINRWNETPEFPMDLQIPPKVTSRAFERLAEINEGADAPKALRVAVEGGGCSGFQYQIDLDEPAADDLVLEGGGQKVVVDQVSLPFLANATIDFTEELIGARFTIDNPNASSSCGCGVSFSM